MADSQRSEKATPQRRKKAREQGQVARSRDISATLGALAVMALISATLPTAFRQWGTLYQRTIDLGIAEDLRPTSAVLFWSAGEAILWSAPALLAAFAVATFSSVAQGGFIFAPAALAPKLSRISPAGKFKQMFSLSGLSMLLKSLLPFGVIALIGEQIIRRDWALLASSTSAGVGGCASLLASRVFELSWKSLLVLLVWSGVDYLLTWRKLESDLKMSKEEIKQEFKESDGNPAVKMRMRKIQRSIRRRRLLKEAERATVVITNPTHFAVALRYELNMEAPIVVSKGRDLLAQQIKDVARWQGIAVVENPPLAQALYRGVEIGQAIPAKLYAAVAEILAFVFRAQEQARARQKRGR
jgi:flagellar biosynthetic protein FlhB